MENNINELSEILNELNDSIDLIDDLCKMFYNKGFKILVNEIDAITAIRRIESEYIIFYVFDNNVSASYAMHGEILASVNDTSTGLKVNQKDIEKRVEEIGKTINYLIRNNVYTDYFYGFSKFEFVENIPLRNELTFSGFQNISAREYLRGL